MAMKSLKSRLRRQDVPGSASSGGAAAASAVSPAARARSGLPALPSRGVLPCSERALVPRLSLGASGSACPGDSSLRRAGDRPLRCPRAPPGPLPAPPGPLSAPRLQVSQLLVLRNQIAASASVRCFWGVSQPRPFPGDPRDLPCSPLLLCSDRAPRGPRRAPLRPRGCGGPAGGSRPAGSQAGGTADPVAPGGDSGLSVSPRLGALSAAGLVAALCWPLSPCHGESLISE